MTILETALKYRSLGFSVIPAMVIPGEKEKQNKKPLVIWGEFEKRIASENEIRNWYQKWPNAGIGIVTGKISNLAVLDVDLGGNISFLKDLNVVSVKTGSGGKHYYFKYPSEGDLRNSAGLISKKIDIRAEGGFVMAPPSHYSGNSYYEWIIPLGEKELTEFPKELLTPKKTLQDFKPILKAYQKEDLINEGDGRNNAAASYAGYLLNKVEPALWESVVWPALMAWDQKMCRPTLGKELRVIFDSISKTDLRNNPEKATANHNEEQASIENNFRPIHHTDLMKTEFPPLEWLVENLIPTEAITIISGNPETYKSWLVTDLIIKSLSNEDLFGKFKTQNKGCLILDEENGLRLMQERAKALTDKESLPLYYLAYSGIKITKGTIDKILSFCKEKDLSTVVFDSFIRFLDGIDENSAADVSKIFGLLKELVKNKITVILIHHHRKEGAIKSSNGQEMRGSSDILASVNCHIIVEKKESKIVIIPNKLREAMKLKPFMVDIEQKKDGATSFTYSQEYEESELSEKLQKSITDLLADKGELTMDQICAALTSSGGIIKVKTNVRYLEKIQSIEFGRSPGRGGKKMYFLASGKGDGLPW